MITRVSGYQENRDWLTGKFEAEEVLNRKPQQAIDISRGVDKIVADLATPVFCYRGRSAVRAYKKDSKN
jgi:hypothetical protein